MREPLPKDVEEARRRKDDHRVFEADAQMPHLWTVDIDSKSATSITSGGDFGVRSFTWSPDSTRIAAGVSITQLTRDERQDIQVITLATKQREPIAASPAIESNPRWSPDGATIAYTMVPIGDAKTNADGLLTRPLFNAHLMLYDVAGQGCEDARGPFFGYFLRRGTRVAHRPRRLCRHGGACSRSTFSVAVSSRALAPP